MSLNYTISYQNFNSNSQKDQNHNPFLGFRKQQNKYKYQYLLSNKNNIQEGLNFQIINEIPYYLDLLEDYQFLVISTSLITSLTINSVLLWKGIVIVT